LNIRKNGGLANIEVIGSSDEKLGVMNACGRLASAPEATHIRYRVRRKDAS
jgi:hypothetical protein